MKAAIVACARRPFHLARKGALATQCLGDAPGVATVLENLG